MPSGKVVRRLRAAVQHHHERHRLTRVAAWDVKLVGAASRLVGKGPLFEAGALRQRGRRTGWHGSNQPVEAEPGAGLAHTVEETAQRFRHLMLARRSGETTKRMRSTVWEVEFRRSPRPSSGGWRHHIDDPREMRLLGLAFISPGVA